MNIPLTIIVYTGILGASIIFYKIVRVFFDINAKLENRRNMGIIKEWINLDPLRWFKGHYFDIFPISFFLHILDKERYSGFSNDVQAMFRQKFKYEMYFWAIFLFGLLLIPVSQILIKY